MSVTKIDLLRRPIHGDGIHVLRLPPWIGPNGGKALYWHKPRSAMMWPGGRISVDFWCGAMRTHASVFSMTDVEPSENKCGTCVGRYEGHVRDRGLIFAPESAWALPIWCPGGDHAGYCQSCGAKSHWHYHWARGATEAKHHPERDLVNRVRPCYRHGWKDVRWVENVGPVCKVWQCGIQSKEQP